MAWERRGSNLYYYQSKRIDGRVRKKYVGTGPLAEAVAHADETIRRSGAAQSERARVELEDARTLASAGEELCEAADILAVAELVASGYHRHKGGEWRMRRRD
jgi:hypothetical protein